MSQEKGSRFNIAVTAASGSDHLLFNSATTALLRVDEETFDSVKSLFGDGRRGVPRDHAPQVPADLDPDVRAALAEGGFIVPAATDEVAELRDAFERARRNGRLTFTVGLTMACNFACPYCFEEHRPEHMSRATADGVQAFVERQIATANAESIFVNWFGGEPLLNVNTLVYLSEQLVAATARAGVRYDSLVITNGALLTRTVAERLVAAGVRNAQVTLDGPREIHDARRPFRGGQASFDRIVENLRDTFDLIRIRVRINVDHTNLGYVRELVRHLHAAGLLTGPNAIEIYAAKVTSYTEQAQMMGETLAQSDIPRLNEPIRQELAALGMPQPPAASPFAGAVSRGGCTAMHHHSFVIGPNGKLFKCELGIHDNEEAIGSVETGQLQVAAAATDVPVGRRRLPVLGATVGSKALDWDAYNPFDNQKCSGCQFVPVCKGGCPKRVIEADTEFMNGTCEHWDRNFTGFIRKMVD